MTSGIRVLGADLPVWGATCVVPHSHWPGYSPPKIPTLSFLKLLRLIKWQRHPPKSDAVLGAVLASSHPPHRPAPSCQAPPHEVSQGCLPLTTSLLLLCFGCSRSPRRRANSLASLLPP